MALYYCVLSLHILGATIWAGGHMVLALSILPVALKQNSASIVLEFEKRYEKLGLHALGLQVLSGLWLAWHILGDPQHWLSNTPVAHAVHVKLCLLVLTGGLALDVKLRVIPKLSDKTLKSLAWHIRTVTILAVLFVLMGASIRVGGYPVFD